MPAAPIIYMADASLKLKLGAGSDVEYNGNVTTAEVVPTPGEETAVTTLDGERHSRFGAPSYALHLVAQQDWSATGLSRFLWDHAGEQATFSLQAHGATVPAAADTPLMAGTVILAEGNYGGEAETWVEAEVTLSCVGRPTLTTTGALAAQAAQDVRVHRPPSWSAPASPQAEDELATAAA